MDISCENQARKQNYFLNSARKQNFQVSKARLTLPAETASHLGTKSMTFHLQTISHLGFGLSIIIISSALYRQREIQSVLGHLLADSWFSKLTSSLV